MNEILTLTVIQGLRRILGDDLAGLLTAPDGDPL
jgi:hypothetical protein